MASRVLSEIIFKHFLENTKGVVVKSTDAGITVDVYTVMSYGVKISEVSKIFRT
ncbi:MAG: Asp23/Gls24 family envelope stress response protein [Streptococcus salivarius]